MNTMLVLNLVIMSALFLGISARQKGLLYLTAGYIVLNALLTAFYPEVLNNYFAGADIEPGLLGIMIGSLKALVYCIAVFVFVMGMKREYIETLKRGLCYLALGNAVWLIYQHAFGHLSYGIMLTSCMDAPMLGIMYPMMYVMSEGRMKWIWRVLPVVAIFLTTSSVGIGALCLALTFMFFKNKKLLILPALVFLVAVISNKDLFSDSYRFICWVWTMKWWGANANHAFGTGLGSYMPLSGYIQEVTGNSLVNGSKVIYGYIHNDWLECLFELGWVGLGLVGALMMNCLIKAYKKPVILASLVAYIGVAVFVFPTEHIITAVIGMLLIRLALEEENA